MFHVSTDAGLLTSRLDVSFYNPDAISVDQMLSQFGRLAKLSDLIDSDRDITNGVRGPDFQESNFRLIRLQDCEGFRINFCDCATISERQFNENRRCIVRDGDVIVAIGGYIGFASVATEVRPAVIGQHSAIIPIAFEKKVLPEYLVAYLNSKIGRIQFQRFVSGTVQQGINLEDVRHIRVPLASGLCQEYIAGKVRQAEDLHAFARAGSERIDDMLAETCNLDPTQLKNLLAEGHAESRKHQTRVSRTSLTDRLDSRFYKPVYLRVHEKLDAGRSVPLAKLTKHIECGPFGGNAIADDLYESKGLPFVRPLNLTGCRFDKSKLVLVSREKLVENGLKCYSGDNLYFGRVGLPAVAMVSGEASISPNVIVAIGDDKLADVGYLYCYCKSPFGLLQLQQELKEGVQPTTSTSAIRRLKVILPDSTTQKTIGDAWRTTDKADDLSLALAESSKLLVESLIERKLTEKELAIAQTKLELGDQTADRAILIRLYAGGIDATDTRPLLPDLDAYYETLKMAEQALADGGDQ